MNVLPDGEHRYRLTFEDGRQIGWIRGRAIRLHGFASVDHVVQVAVRAWRVLQGVLRDAAPHWHLVEPGALRLVHDGAYEWISDGRIPIARIHRPSSRNDGKSSFAIELVVPAKSDDALAITAARAIAAAIEPASTSRIYLRPSPQYIP